MSDGWVLIKPHGPDYLDQVYEAVLESRAELMLWMPWIHADYSIKDTREWLKARPEAWEQGTDYAFAIFDCQDGFFLGSCGLNHINRDDGFANLGYWVRTDRVRRGAATAAARLLARFGFEELKLNRIEIVVATGNKASQRVADKVGATREGVLRNRIVVRDKVYDAVMFSLIPHDLL
ncbi:MAG: GNAT family N-acetyltransferase [Deltaproteobacteria bacterium]|nr:GNAT family N-acetyltransferase [Deltaproteobacteria bacterium]